VTTGDGASPRVVSPWNPANAVTASRYLTLPLFWWAVAHDHRQYATLFILLCGLLDKFDGPVARMFHCSSAFGEMFDAITDAICFGFALVIVTAYGWAPVGPVVLVVVMGVANAGMRFIYLKRCSRVVNYRSYAMERIVVVTGYQIAFATSGMEVTFFYYAFVPVLFVIVIHDAKRMLFDPIPDADGQR
jgi:phosphatidylglycerophosphate synthase